MVVTLGVGMDPGNWILFLMFQVLIHIRNKTKISLPGDVTEHLARINVAQEVSPNMKLGPKRLEYVGDILEAIGGICHPWASTSSKMIKEMIAEIAQDDLVVLTISIDKKKEDWENEISKEDSPVEELSYLMIDYENSPITKQFNVSLIPRYMVYDKTGELAYEVAPRPSSGDLKPLLLELLGDGE